MRLFLLLLVLGLPFCCLAQADVADSLRHAYTMATSEERRIDLLNELSFEYNKVSLEKSKEMALEALDRSNAIHYQKGIGQSYNSLGIGYSIGGLYDKGLEFFQKAMKVMEGEKDVGGLARVLNNLAGIYLYQKDYERALEYSGKSLALVRRENNQPAIGNALFSLGMIYEHKRDTSMALAYWRQALTVFKELNNKSKEGEVLIEISQLFEEMNQHEMALDACFRAMDKFDIEADHTQTVALYEAIGQIYANLGNENTAGHYFHLALRLADHHKAVQEQMSARLKLSSLFEKHRRFDSALFYHKAYADLNRETFSGEMADQLAMLEKVYETEKKDDQLQLNNQKIQSQRWIIVAISGFLLLTTVTGFMLYRYYREKKHANIQLSDLNRQIYERNEEITVQSEELMEANEEIRRINESLEEEVNYRTEKIRIQNEKLIEYAYFNAHKVRGPLARILGLAILIDTQKNEDEMRELNKKIQESAEEMDRVIKEINRRLEGE